MLALQTAARAEPTPDASATGEVGLAEIVVTAEKRTQRLQDVAMSINAASGAQLQSLGITNTEQLEKLVPGFSVDRTAYGLPVFLIRGIGFNDTSLGVSPAVTVYVDQVPLPFSVMSRGAILDLERVEVLKGPQGTLFGENSTGGAINYIAAKPTRNFQAGAQLSYGRFNETSLEAYVSGPLSDTLSARLAVREEYMSAWQRGYTVDQSNGQRRLHNGRLLLDWAPTDAAKFELTVGGWVDRSESQQPQNIQYTPLVTGPGARVVPFPVETYPAAPDDPRAAAWTPGDDLQQHNSLTNVALRGDIRVADAVTLTSLTSYQRYKQELPIDWSGTVYPVARTVDHGRITSFSQELRLDGAAGVRVKWMVGGNYERDRVDEHQDFNPIVTSGTHVGPFNFDTFAIDNDQTIKSRSVFGSLDFQFSEQFSSQTSIRYTKQDRHFEGCARDSGDGQSAGAVGFLSFLITGVPQTIPAGACFTLGPVGVALPIVTGDLDESNVSWRESLNWKPNRDSLVYANVTKGYKAGSFPTQPSTLSIQFQPVKQESVLAYEIGFKHDTASRAAQFNAAVFFYDYKDKQLAGYLVVPPFGPLPQLVSIPKAKVQGAEVSMVARPIEALTLSANLTYVDTKVRENPINPTGPYGNPTDFTDKAFPFTPKWQGVAGAQYRYPMASGLSGFLGADVTFRSSANAALLSGDSTVAAFEDLLKIKSYALFDVRAGIEPANGPWRIEIWGRNVGNKRYATGVGRTSDFTTRFTGMPRTYGVSMSYRFGQ